MWVMLTAELVGVPGCGLDGHHRPAPAASHSGTRLACGLHRDGLGELIESAQSRWRAVNAPRLVALVRAGAKFEKGKLV
jgi:hypothetical protein